jgi:hypothetical protein
MLHLASRRRPAGLRRNAPGSPDPSRWVPLGILSRRIGVSVSLLLGCTVTSDEHRFPPNPEKLRILATVPEPGATGVSPDVQVDVCLSGLVDPRTVTDADATLSSGSSRFDSSLAVQLVAWSGPGGSSLAPHTEGPWCRGSVLSITPRAPLQPGVLYRVRLRPSVVGWHGERLDTDMSGWTADEEGEVHHRLEFTVSERAPDPDPGSEEEEEHKGAPTLTDLFSVGAIFDPERETCGCHGNEGELAHALLDLRTPESAFDHLVAPTRSRDTGFPMVTPRRPSESFLLHKLLRDDHGAAIEGVLGDPMPPDEPLPHADLVALMRWIEGGAEP